MTSSKSNKQKAKKLKYHIFPLGDGWYFATWQEKGIIYEMKYNDQNEQHLIKKMKNPYKHCKFPFVVIPFESNKKESGE